MLEFLLTGDAIFALLTLTFLEIVLGIDNIIFISIIANKLPENQRAKATNIGLVLAMVLGGFGSLMLAFFVDYLDEKLGRIEDVEENLQLPVLASIPEFKNETT